MVSHTRCTACRVVVPSPACALRWAAIKTVSDASSRGRCRDSTIMSKASAASPAPSGTPLPYARLPSCSLSVHVSRMSDAGDKASEPLATAASALGSSSASSRDLEAAHDEVRLCSFHSAATPQTQHITDNVVSAMRPIAGYAAEVGPGNLP